MKALKNILVLGLIMFALTACKDNSTPEVKTVAIANETEVSTPKLDPNANYAKVEFGIEGMTCAMGCAKTIEKKIAKMEGIKTAKVDFDKRLAMVEYDEAKVTHQSLEDAVTSVGDVYKVKDMKTVESFEVEKKACQPDCKKACCSSKAKTEKKACAKDCDKACCADKKK